MIYLLFLHMYSHTSNRQSWGYVNVNSKNIYHTHEYTCLKTLPINTFVKDNIATFSFLG